LGHLHIDARYRYVRSIVLFVSLCRAVYIMCAAPYQNEEKGRAGGGAVNFVGQENSTDI
jgi:hypothetical protein